MQNNEMSAKNTGQQDLLDNVKKLTIPGRGPALIAASIWRRTFITSRGLVIMFAVATLTPDVSSSDITELDFAGCVVSL